MDLTQNSDLVHISATPSFVTLLPLRTVNSMLLAHAISLGLPFHSSCLNASSLFFCSTPSELMCMGMKKIVRNIFHLRNQGQGREFSWRQFWDSECWMKLETWQDRVTQALGLCVGERVKSNQEQTRETQIMTQNSFIVPAVYLHWMATDWLCRVPSLRSRALTEKTLFVF